MTGLGRHFRDSEEYQLLEPYTNGDGRVAGYRVVGLLSRDPWRHTTSEATAPDGQPVALKVIRLQAGPSRREAKSFHRRLSARAQIEHPHLLPIFDWGRVDGGYYVAMGMYQAFSLADLIAAGPVEAKVCLRLFRQLADALETAHESWVIHRELVPQNVLHSSLGGGHVRLGDFGLVHPEGDCGPLDLVEPLRYESPEKLRGEALSPASNVYSLACMLVECLTGSPPYTSELPGVVAYAHAFEPPPRLSERRPDLPPTLDDLVAEAMAKDADERLASPRRLVTAVAGAMGLGGPQPRSYSAPQERGPDDSSATVASGGVAVPSQTFGHLSPRNGPRSAPTPSAVLALVLAAVVAGSGALGFILARRDEGSQMSRATANVPSRVRVQRHRQAVLRETGAVFERLNARRGHARRRLATARTRRGQAAAAAQIASAYGDAAQAVSRKSRDTAPVAASLKEAGRAYRRLEVTAHRGNHSRYVVAVRAVRRSEEGLQKAVSLLTHGSR